VGPTGTRPLHTSHGDRSVHRIQELRVAWMVCREDSGWNPDPSTDGGTIWYKVPWDQQTPSTAYFESPPNADGTAWAYSGYLYPTGHNGEVPWC
jgi:hypothetical protein